MSFLVDRLPSEVLQFVLPLVNDSMLAITGSHTNAILLVTLYSTAFPVLRAPHYNATIMEPRTLFYLVRTLRYIYSCA